MRVEWRLCDHTGWPDNPSYQNLVAWSWGKDDDRYLIVTNLSDSTVQARVRVPWSEVRGQTWRLSDVLSGVIYDRDGDEMHAPGLFVELEPWDCSFFQCERLQSGSKRINFIEAGSKE